MYVGNLSKPLIKGAGGGGGNYLLAQGNLFEQGLGAGRQVGLSEALGRLGVGPQQVGLEVLALHSHGIKPERNTCIHESHLPLSAGITSQMLQLTHLQP